MLRESVLTFLLILFPSVAKSVSEIDRQALQQVLLDRIQVSEMQVPDGPPGPQQHDESEPPEHLQREARRPTDRLVASTRGLVLLVAVVPFEAPPPAAGVH